MTDFPTPIPWRTNRGQIFAGVGTDSILVAVTYNGTDRRIAQAVNAHDDLVAALQEIAKGEGPYARDLLTHMRNTIAAMKGLADAALAKAGKATT